MSDLTKMMPLLVSMRAMCDALLLEIAEEQKPKEKPKQGPSGAKPHTHEVDPGFGPTGICKVCGETVAREVKDG
jgi:hypothetical protein